MEVSERWRCQRRFGSIHPKAVLAQSCRLLTGRNPNMTWSFYTELDNMVSQNY